MIIMDEQILRFISVWPMAYRLLYLARERAQASPMEALRGSISLV
jgi:hypothetical protein